MDKYFLVLEYDKDDKITTCLAHSNDKNGIGYCFAYTYVMPSDLYSRYDIVWTKRQIKRLRRNYKKHNQLDELNHVLSKVCKTKIMPKSNK